MTPALGFVLGLAATLAVLAAPAPARADEKACLGKAEQTAALSNGQTVTLATAIRSARGSVRGRGSREVVRARLCREEKGLVYLLTVLARDGKVSEARVDAADGQWLDGSSGG